MTTEQFPEDPHDAPAMQTRCVHCLGEQYSLNVISFSAGTAPCHLCGKHTEPMTYEQWYAALREARRRTP